MYRVRYPILEEWMGSEVGEVVIAAVKWWALHMYTSLVGKD